jgi:DNA-binding HxlR family transcriptional regulator
MPRAVRGGEACSIARAVDLLKDPWAFLVLREAFGGVSRFSQLRANLGIASDVLTERLTSLVAAGVLRREEYREPGSRARSSYHLTAAGEELKPVLAALQQWGDAHLPVPCGPTVLWRHRATGDPVGVAFVDADGHAVDREDAVSERTAAYPA